MEKTVILDAWATRAGDRFFTVEIETPVAGRVIAFHAAEYGVALALAAKLAAQYGARLVNRYAQGCLS